MLKYYWNYYQIENLHYMYYNINEPYYLTLNLYDCDPIHT